MKRTLIVIVALSLLACCGVPKPKPTPVDPADATACPAACEHLRALGCEEGQPLEDGTSCEAWCEATQEAGHALRPSCVVTISTCEELESKCAKPR